MNYVLAFFASFISVFLKGFQHKNVVANLYVNTAVTSYAMAVMDVLLIGLISKSDWTIAFTTGTGATLGMVTAMYLHNKFFAKRIKDAKEN